MDLIIMTKTKQEQLQEDWEELTPGQMIKLEPGDSIEGDFISIKESDDPDFKNSYTFTVEMNKEIKSVYVNNIVNDFVNQNKIEPGQRVKLIYKGLRKNKKGTFDYKEYAFFVKK